LLLLLRLFQFSQNKRRSKHEWNSLFLDGNTDVKTFDEKYIMFKNVKKVEKIIKKRSRT